MYRRRGLALTIAILAVVVTVLGSCESTESPNECTIDTTAKRTVRDIDYVKNTYFFFTLGGPLPQAGTVDVWREVKPPDKLIDPELLSHPGRAFIDFDGTGASINAAIAPLATGAFPSATSEKGEFELLQIGTDYRFVVWAVDLVSLIGIELTRPISENEQRVLAVTYTNEGPDGVPGTGDEQQVGGQRYNSLLPANQQLPANQDTLVLKIIKNRTPRSLGEFSFLWDFMMRNNYNLGLSNIDPESFRLEIEDNLFPRPDPTTPDSVAIPYIQIFGLDRFDALGTPGPDNRIDLIAGMVDLQNGILTFPSFHPFAPDPADVDEWTNSEFAFIGRFQLQYEVSDSMYTVIPEAPWFQNLHQYRIVVTVGGVEDCSLLDLE